VTGTETSIRVGSADGRLFLDVRGDAGAPPLLYLHGGPGLGCHEFMSWQGDRLSGRLRLIGLDQRGVLRSDPLRPGATLSEGDLVDDCEALREWLGVERWALLGHSFGGRVALRYAHRYPDRVSAVVFENPAWDVTETERLRLPAAAAIFEELGDTDAAAACRAVAAGRRNDLWESVELVSRLERHGRYHDLYVHQPAAREEFDRMVATNPYPREWRERGNRHGALLMETADVMVSVLPLLAGLRAPALLVKGMYDLVTGPGQLASFRSAVLHGVVEVFERSGHFVQLEEPERYAEVVGGFVRRYAR
jgi:proline iminopeptidase